MGTLYEEIQALCKNKGVSGSRMCLDLGLSKSTLSDLKNGRTKGISIPTAQKIAGYFGITVDELYGVEEKKEQPIEFDGLSKKQEAFIYKVIKMSDAELDRLDKFLELLENTNQ